MRKTIMLVGAALLLGALACNKDKPAEDKLAPVASALEAAKPAAESALPFKVDMDSSSLTFLLDFCHM